MDRPEDRLALIELLERDGRAARAVDVWQWPLTIGRALDNHLVLDDPCLAPQHARLEADPEGCIQLVLLDSTNGAVFGGRHHRGGEQIALPAAGAILQLGATRLRLRLPAEVLAPELQLSGGTTRGAGGPVLAGTLLLVLMVAGHWLGLDPGADATAWLPMLAGLPMALALWCGLWALMSKLFQHRFDFWGHVRIVLPWLLAIDVVGVLLPQAAASLAWPGLWHVTPALLLLLAALLVRAHLVHVLPLHRRAVSAAAAAVLLVGGAISLTLSHRATDRYTRAPYMSTLPLPALHWATPVPAATLVQGMAPLAERLARRVTKAREEEEDESSEGATSD
jgi:hypothetical protein